MARKCEQPKKDGSPCEANALVGKDYCQAHGPKEEDAVLSMEDTLEAISEAVESAKGRVARIEKESAKHDERLDVIEGRQDVFHEMLEEDAKIERAWKPIPKERYPRTFAEDPNNKWVIVTPLKDGEVAVRGGGVNFTVEFKRGITMGTFTTFVGDARNKGIIP